MYRRCAGAGTAIGGTAGRAAVAAIVTMEPAAQPGEQSWTAAAVILAAAVMVRRRGRGVAGTRRTRVATIIVAVEQPSQP